MVLMAKFFLSCYTHAKFRRGQKAINGRDGLTQAKTAVTIKRKGKNFFFSSFMVQPMASGVTIAQLSMSLYAV